MHSQLHKCFHCIKTVTATRQTARVFAFPGQLVTAKLDVLRDAFNKNDGNLGVSLQRSESGACRSHPRVLLEVIGHEVVFWQDMHCLVCFALLQGECIGGAVLSLLHEKTSGLVGWGTFCFLPDCGAKIVPGPFCFIICLVHSRCFILLAMLMWRPLENRISTRIFEVERLSGPSVSLFGTRCVPGVGRRTPELFGSEIFTANLFFLCRLQGYQGSRVVSVLDAMCAYLLKFFSGSVICRSVCLRG